MRESTFWTWHLVAGAVILLLLGLHMVIMHLDGLVGFMNLPGYEPVHWENIVHRAQYLFFTATYVLLLGAALYHGLYGSRTLLFELDLKPAGQRFVTIAVWVLGVALFVLGGVANVVVHLRQTGG